MTKATEAYGTRENWPPYTYRDYPGIKPEAYEAFMKFLDTENDSGRLMELATMGFCLRLQNAHFAISQPQPQAKCRLNPTLTSSKKNSPCTPKPST